MITADEVQALQDKLETRLDGMDKAIGLLESFTSRQPTTAAVAQSVEKLEVLVNEKFKGVADLMQAYKATVEALDRANDKAITKSEQSFSDQLKQLSNLLNTKTDALNEKIGEAKGRLIFQMISSAASLAAIIGLILVMMRMP